MLESLTIKGFRGHRERKLEKLARVNLLVGVNNAGKTAVLDALELLLRDGHPRTLAWLATRRSGDYSTNLIYREGDPLPESVRYLFFGYGDAGSASFELSSTGSPNRGLMVRWEDHSDNGAYPGAGTIDIFRNGRDQERLQTSPELAVFGGRTEATGIQRSPERVQFVTPVGATAKSMKALWDSIVGNAEEDDVLAAMQILDKRIERIVFSSDGDNDATARIFVRLKGLRDRVPLSSLGDGMRRMLGIAIRAVRARSGTLLLDEVDSGLHYSAMTNLWHWLCTYATTSNTQIFATTHNSDCINALGWLHKSNPQLTDSVAAFRLDPNEINAIRYSASELETVAEEGLEVRA